MGVTKSMHGCSASLRPREAATQLAEARALHVLLENDRDHRVEHKSNVRRVGRASDVRVDRLGLVLRLAQELLLEEL